MTKTEINAKITELKEMEAIIADANAVIEGIKDELKAEMEANGTDTLATDLFKATWKEVTSSRFNKALMVTTFGQEAYDACCKTTTTKTFRVA